MIGWATVPKAFKVPQLDGQTGSGHKLDHRPWVDGHAGGHDHAVAANQIDGITSQLWLVAMVPPTVSSLYRISTKAL